MSDYPKMVYSNLIDTPEKVLFTNISYKIVNDEDEEAKAISSGWSLSSDGVNEDMDEREEIVDKAKSLGIKTGRKSTEKLLEEIAEAEASD